MMNLRKGAALAACGMCAFAASAGVTTVDFSMDDNGLAIVNGQDISSPAEYFAAFTLSSSGNNAGLAAFDSTLGGPNAGGPDPDLLVGLGNVLILQNSGSSQSVPGIFDTPNDDADGGVIVFNFTTAVELVSIDLVDIDASAQTTVTMTDSFGLSRVYDVPNNWTFDLAANGGAGYGTLDLATLADQLGEAGNTATATEDAGFDASSVVALEVDFSGSGALDNLVFVPAPGSAMLLAVGGLVATRRRR